MRYLPRPSITRAPFGGESVALVSDSAICLSLITTVIFLLHTPARHINHVDVREHQNRLGIRNSIYDGGGGNRNQQKQAAFQQ